jgi:hypothetical protein
MGILKWLCGPRTVVMVALTCATAVLWWVDAGSAAADNTIVVNTTQTTYTQGDGLCALGEAVDYANGGSDPDCSTAARSGTTTIEQPAGKYEVPGTLELDLPTNITGAGASQTDLDGGGIQQVLKYRQHSDGRAQQPCDHGRKVERTGLLYTGRRYTLRRSGRR